MYTGAPETAKHRSATAKHLSDTAQHRSAIAKGLSDSAQHRSERLYDFFQEMYC